MIEEQSKNRVIVTNSDLGMRQLRDVLSGTLMSHGCSPSDIWLVSPWITDFDLLDNRSLSWAQVNPSWGARLVRFTEVLIWLVDSGSRLRVVLRDDPINKAFLGRMNTALGGVDAFKTTYRPDLHVKGLLTRSIWIAGSMNFTHSGVNKNDEQVTLYTDEQTLVDVRLEFERSYD